MTLERSREAALRILAARVGGAEVDLIDVERAGWVVGAAGHELPTLPDATEDLHVRLAAAFGGGDDDAGFALLAEHATTDDGNRLLFHACHLVGDRCADRLIEFAEQHPDVWFSGTMLARTRDPVRLLALVDADHRLPHIVGTCAELVIRGRDRGSPTEAIERRWSELNELGKTPGYVASFRDAELRLAARVDMERAIVRLDALATAWGYDEQDGGTEAVLGRLVRSDPDRACEIVARREDPDNRVAWLDPIVRWHELPAAAVPIVDALLSLDQLDKAITLVRVMILARAWPQLDRALANVTQEPALEIASRVASAIAELRDAGFHDDAEAASARVRTVLGEHRTTTEVDPRDLFEMLSSPKRPPLVPWVPDPGIP